MEMAPASGMTRPTMLRIRVLLPAPLGPSKPRHSAARSSRVMPSTAVTWRKRFTSASTRKGAPLALEVAREDKPQLSPDLYGRRRVYQRVGEVLMNSDATRNHLI